MELLKNPETSISLFPTDTIRQIPNMILFYFHTDFAVGVVGLSMYLVVRLVHMLGSKNKVRNDKRVTFRCVPKIENTDLIVCLICSSTTDLSRSIQTDIKRSYMYIEINCKDAISN